MKKSKKVIALALAALMAVSAFAGCGGGDDANNTTTTTKAQGGNTDATTTKPTDPPYEMSILLPYGDHAHDELDLTIEFRNQLEAYTNTKITWELYAANAYYEKLTLKYASGELATIMVTDQNAEFMSACKYNTFWDLTNYLDLYDNLTVIPEVTRMNASNNGKLYGVPRSRDLGRNACAYRQDWADNLGLPVPKTIDDLYEMAVAFTNDDPDGNGKNDTYGFGLDAWDDQWLIMLPWFGCHNGFGFADDGKTLEHYITQDEFKTALKAFRQWNSEGLINEGWDALGAGAAEKSIFRTNQAGISVQVADCPRKSQEAMNGTAEKPGNYPEARFTYFGALEDGTHGYNVLPTAGYAGYVAITKALAPTENDLTAALQFINDLNDAEMRNLIDFGLLGKDYYVDDNGFAVRYDADWKTANGISNSAYREGYNQMVPYYSNAEETAKVLVLDNTTYSDIKKAEIAIKEENLDHLLPNYGAGYNSDTYTDVGSDLEQLRKDMIKQYVLGEIDDTTLDVMIQQWRDAGGDKYVAEINAAYQAAQAK